MTAEEIQEYETWNLRISGNGNVFHDTVKTAKLIQAVRSANYRETLFIAGLRVLAKGFGDGSEEAMEVKIKEILKAGQSEPRSETFD